MVNDSEVKERIEHHLIRNKELLRVIQRKGFCIDDARLIECHFWSPSETEAENLSTELRKRSFTQLRLNESDGGVWNLEMTVRQSASSTASKEFTTEMTMTAARFDSVYDGWGTLLSD